MFSLFIPLIVAEYSLNYKHVTNFADPWHGLSKIFRRLCVIIYKNIITKTTNKLQLCRLIYYSLSAVHVSGCFRPSSGALYCIYSVW
jgi:hypothetical protein